jgi:hypothetical protein
MRYFIVGILLATILLACSGQDMKYTSYLPEDIMLPSLSDVYPHALEEAYLWFDEPFLYTVILSLDTNMIAYFFQSSKIANTFVNVYAFFGGDNLKIESESGESSIVQEYSFEIIFEDIIAIDDAYKVAYEAGGEHFFSISSDSKPKVIISLNQIHSRETLVCTISFIDDELGSVIIDLDAFSGDVINLYMSDAFREE